MNPEKGIKMKITVNLESLTTWLTFFALDELIYVKGKGQHHKTIQTHGSTMAR